MDERVDIAEETWEKVKSKEHSISHPIGIDSDITYTDGNGITIKELSYYLFFGIMIVAKGLGLDSGDRLYIVLSLVALVAVSVKIILTRHTYQEIIAMGFLCLIAFISYRNSGRMGIMLTVLAVIGIKEVDIKKLFQLGMILYGISFGMTVFLAGWGLIPNPLVVHEKAGLGEVIRWGMGYSTGNVFHISYFILVVFILQGSKKEADFRKYMILLAGNLLIYCFSLSYTGVAVTTFYLVLNYYFKKRRKCNRAEMLICQLFFPVILIFSFVGPLFIKTPLIAKLDHMLQARLSFSNYYLTNQPITFLGTRMKDIPSFWIIMDNGYVYILMTFGILVILLFVSAYLVLIYRLLREQKKGELAVVLSFLLYGFMEQFISNAFMNISLFYIAVMFFSLMAPKLKQKDYKMWQYEISVWKSRYLIGDIVLRVREDKVEMLRAFHKDNKMKSFAFRLWWLPVSGAILGGAFYIMAVKVPDFITVPLATLPYAEAQSVLIYADNTDGSKIELKGVMNSYRGILENEIVIKEAVVRTGLFTRLSTDEIRTMLDFSIPVFAQGADTVNTFRVRMLYLFYGYTDDDYRVFLQELLDVASVEQDKLKLRADEITEERIGFSSGTERIEHIENADVIRVEKNGSIVGIEWMRKALIWIMSGMLTGVILSGAVGLTQAKWECNRRKENENCG